MAIFKMKDQFLTDIIFFDTDCISAFLWVDKESIIEELYSGRIVIPRSVYSELSNPRVSWMKEKIDNMIDSGSVRIEDIYVGSDEFELYQQLTSVNNPIERAVGRREAAALCLAKKYDAIIASNNLRDISFYVEEYNLTHITTGDILVTAYNSGLIDEDKGNEIWGRMLAKRRKVGADSFSEYLGNYGK